MAAFTEALRSGRPLLMDGAMGTELIRHGMPAGACFEAWNLSRPDTVLAIHRGYVEAGATILLSNTFQAFPARLASFGLRDRTRAIIEAGVELARQALGGRGFVLGTLGPVTATDDELDEMLHAFCGADGLVLETLSDTRLLERVQGRPGSRELPILFSATYLAAEPGPVTFEGWTPREVATRAAAAGAVALGFNCGKDIDEAALARIFEEYREATDVPLFARPNAGTPLEENGRLVFPLDAAAFARRMAALVGKLAMVGGCCGTTPEYVRALSVFV